MPSPRLPRAVVFDLGKVLLDFDYDIAAKRFAELSNVTWEQVGGIITTTLLLYRFETGRIDSAQFFVELRSSTGYRGTFGQFQEIFSAIFTPIPDMIRLHQELKDRGIPTFIFSNTNELAMRYVRETYPFFGGFDDYVLSYEHGSMKPEPALYEVVERRTGLAGPDLLYIDDRPENIEEGVRRGWQVILQETPEATRRQVEARGCLS